MNRSTSKRPAPSQKGSSSKKKRKPSRSDEHRSDERTPHSTSSPSSVVMLHPHQQTQAGKSHGVQPLGSPNSQERTEERAFELTGLYPGDIDAVTTLINESEQRIIRHVNAGYRKVMEEIKTNENVTFQMAKTLNTMDGNVSLLKKVTMQNSTAIARSQKCRAGSSKSKKKNGSISFEEEIEVLNPTVKIEFQAVFDPLLLCQAAAYCVSSYMEFFHGTQDDVRMTARVIKVLLFGLKNKSTMAEYKRGAGKQIANLRFKIAKTAAMNALLITDESFREREQQALAEMIRKGCGENDLIANQDLSSGKPSWLAPEVLTAGMLKMARKQHDSVMSEWDPIPRAMAERKALYICRGLYKSVIDMLRRSRDRCRQRMYGAGTFLLREWRGTKAFTDGHCNPEFRFVYPLAAPISSQTIELSNTTSQPEHVGENTAMLKSLMESRQEMILEATYNVTVTSPRRDRFRNERNRDVESRSGDDRSADTVTEIRKMKRHLSIIGISLAFMEAYFQCPKDIVLSSHPSMIRNIYRVALLLREFFIDNLHDTDLPTRAKLSSARSNDIAPDRNNRSQSNLAGGFQTPEDDAELLQLEHRDRNNVTSNRTASWSTESPIPEAVLEDILPSPSEVDKEMCKLLKMSKENFEKLCIMDGHDEHSNRDQIVIENVALDKDDSEDEEAEGMFDD